MNGGYCCKEQKERQLDHSVVTPQNEIDDGTCDGVDFNRQSKCCNHNHAPCPHASGCFDRIGIRFGVTDLDVNGIFKYESDDTLLPFTPVWNSGEPNSVTTENCVQFHDSAEKWQVWNCGGLSFSICEMSA